MNSLFGNNERQDVSKPPRAQLGEILFMNNVVYEATADLNAVPLGEGVAEEMQKATKPPIEEPPYEQAA